jgi:hypothetical protein
MMKKQASLSTVRAAILEKLKRDHRGEANAISRKALFDFIGSRFPELDDRAMRRAVEKTPKVCWTAKPTGYFIAARKPEVDRRIRTLTKYRDTISIHIARTKTDYPEFYDSGKQEDLPFEPNQD